MDFLRSCYVGNYSFFNNRPDLVTRVRWYWCQDGAADLGIPTRFASGNWAGQHDVWPGTGEVIPRQRRWYSGRLPAQFAGIAPAGSPLKFLNGSSFPPSPFPRMPNGVPQDCMPVGAVLGIFGNPGFIRPAEGVQLGFMGGTGLLPPTCAGMTWRPDHYALTLSGFADSPTVAWSALNGSWTVPSNAPSDPCLFFGFVASSLFTIQVSQDATNSFGQVRITQNTFFSPEVRLFDASPGFPFWREVASYTNEIGSDPYAPSSISVAPVGAHFTQEGL